MMLLNSPSHFRRLMNLWPPFLGAGIRVRHISNDWRTITVTLTRRWFNKNYRGTHFGGSLFAMTDPFYMLMLMHSLGKGYAVWDKSAQIEFVKPVKEPVVAAFELDSRRIEQIKRMTANGEKVFETFQIEVKNKRRDTVARVIKTIYIRREEHRH